MNKLSLPVSKIYTKRKPQFLGQERLFLFFNSLNEEHEVGVGLTDICCVKTSRALEDGRKGTQRASLAFPNTLPTFASRSPVTPQTAPRRLPHSRGQGAAAALGTCGRPTRGASLRGQCVGQTRTLARALSILGRVFPFLPVLKAKLAPRFKQVVPLRGQM